MSCLDWAGCFLGPSGSSAFFSGLIARCLSSCGLSARIFSVSSFGAGSFGAGSFGARRFTAGSFTAGNFSACWFGAGSFGDDSLSGASLSTSNCGSCRCFSAGSSGDLSARRCSFHFSAGGTLCCCGSDQVGAEIQPLCKRRQHSG